MDDSGLDVTLRHLKSQIDRIALAVLGDPSDTQKPGHSIRLDRLEQTNKWQGRLIVALGSVILTIAASVTVAFIVEAL